MDIQIDFFDDPMSVLSKAAEFLPSQPVLHNLILTLLHTRVAQPEPGRYWLALDQERVVGVALQSPLTFAAVLTPMDKQAAVAMVNAIAEADISLPGIIGEAATAAAFAGHWSERRKTAATPFQGMRLYELLEAVQVTAVDGQLRQALPGDRDLIVRWTRAFQIEIDESADRTELRVDRGLAAGEFWIWEDGEPVSMAVSRKPVEGVVRVTEVYTPQEKRKCGYAAACVHALSKRMCEASYRCALYTDLANPTSNSVYRRIGYRAVSEVLRYRFA